MMQSLECSLLFRGGLVIDGTGTRGVIQDVAVENGVIVATGDLSRWRSRETIDIAGRALCPGFIDAHTHDDHFVFADPSALPRVSQGVTTVVVGNCGVSLAPFVASGELPSPFAEVAAKADFRFARFRDYLDALEGAPPAVNVAALVGHTTLRAATMDRLDRPATASERMAMRSLAAEAMAAGAIGMSSGLFYPPARAAPMEEVMAIAEVVSEYGGIYATHLRDEAGAIDAAIDEALLIAERAEMPLIISHHKLMGEANFGRAPETLRRIVQASTRQEVAFDVYPYVAAASSFNLDLYRLSKRVLITWSAVMPDAAGRELDEIAAELGMSAEAAMTALAPGGAVYFCMDENDLRHILASPDAMIGSDGTTTSIRPHPRLWGTFTRVLGRYARDEGLFPFEEAIRRMTSLPARRFRMAGRGVIAAGAAADLVVLDPATVADAADFDNPVQPSRGVESVYVSGLPVYRDGAATGVRPGCILKGQQKRLK